MDNDLPLKKNLKLYNMVIVAKSLFYEGKKYYPQVFLDKCLNKLYMLEYVRIDMSEGIDINKTIDLLNVLFVITGTFFN